MNATQEDPGSGSLNKEPSPTYYSHPEVNRILDPLFPKEADRQSVKMVLKGIVTAHNLRECMKEKDKYFDRIVQRKEGLFPNEYYAHMLTRSTYRATLDMLVCKGILKRGWYPSVWWRPKYTMGSHDLYHGYDLLPVTEHRVRKKIDTYAEYKLRNYPTVKRIVIPHIIDHFHWVDLTRAKFLTMWEDRFNNEYHIKHPDPRKRKSLDEYMTIGEYVWMSIDTWNGASESEKFQWFNVCAFGRRLHYPFTYWPKDVRAYILDKQGNPIRFVEYDLANSQPLIFADMMVRKYPVLRQCEFVRRIESQTIYENMCEKLNLTPEYRGYAKNEMMHWLYCRSKRNAQKQFIGAYGAIANEAKKIKMQTKDQDGRELSEDQRHRILAQMMQRYESDMFNPIWIEMINMGYVILPIHDAIYCANINECERGAIKEYITEQLRKHLVLNIKVRDEEVFRRISI